MTLPTLLAGIMMITGSGWADEDRYITVASTTSTENSGLLAEVLPKFTAETGIEVRVIALGTGQAIRVARNGDADVLLVHHTPSEEQFVADGFGVKRYPVMHNDFVIVGPSSDPAGINEMANAALALARIAETKAAFASRGDDSGTHKKELSMWQAAEINPAGASGTWYRETGSGMGATLNAASGMNAYALSDRATWVRFGNKGDLVLHVEGDRRLFNPYGVILVNAEKHPHVKSDDGQKFIDWLVGEPGQNAIAAYRIQGQPAFFPDMIVE
ncbi:MAG: substrate-binding domain-containing protein [Gammaproteobacteria bacterium]|nr:MAG: substrate-binding domain-containing protein [Gammaproteobacteria bacterium]